MYTWISFEPYEGFGENTEREMLKVQNKREKRKILTGRVDIVTWRSRYLLEVLAYGDNAHLMFYMHKIWTDSNLTFCKCAVIGIHTHVNSGNRLIMLHTGGIGGFLPLCISHLQG